MQKRAAQLQKALQKLPAMHRAAAAALLLAPRPPGAPREALKRHEAEHDAAHAKEAAGDVAHLAEAVETRRGTVAAIKKTGGHVRR